MKIRKALERAKKERQSNILKPSAEERSLKNIQDAPGRIIPKVGIDKKPVPIFEENSEKSDEWKAPEYNESKEIKLNLKALKKNKCISMFPGASENEAYKILRTRILQRTRVKDLKTIMVTSSLPGEGKSLTSINLSITLAKEFNQTILLVDCDLRQQKIHKHLGFKSDTGLIDYLEDRNLLKDLFIWPGIEKFTLISGGKTVTDSSEFLGSPKMKRLVRELKDRYKERYIILDTPPLLSGADTMTLIPLVDSIILVVEAGRTSISDVKKSLDLIPKEKFLGFVLNRNKIKSSKYVYGYN